MKKQHLLLINPVVYDFSYFDLWAKPLGLLYIAGILRKENFEITFIDCLEKFHPKLEKFPKLKKYGTGKFYFQVVEKPELLKNIPKRFKRFGLPKEILIEEFKKLKRVDAILLTSGMTYWYLGLKEIIELLKENFKNVPIILGGIYATLCYEHAKNLGVDFVIRGEGEIQILNLLENIFSLDIKAKYESIDEYPYPAFDLLKRIDYGIILTSRGCPYNCTYCASHKLQGNFRERNPLKVVEEIEFLVSNFKIKDIAFYDDALFYNKEKRIVIILEEIVKRGIKVNFHTPNAVHPKYIDRNLAKLLYITGFKTIRLGLETINEERLKKTGNKLTIKEFENSIKFLKEANFTNENIGAYILVGLPGQTYEEVKETIVFVKNLGVKPILTEYSPIPGTPDFFLTKSQSLLDIEEPLFQNNSLLPFRSNIFGKENFQILKNLANSV
jgi:radical SAM superfamily enzyme YgiQ (UPF0313 family)